ncbi:hypothetical protein D1BOALGB6SA_384 [Olavius sp. associated proteobacterium Delta 1]|nr:hypothetical protein D1BOALGB6SA_384 [Olavius sp. associated proteobacterium Delta 1]
MDYHAPEKFRLKVQFINRTVRRHFGYDFICIDHHFFIASL